MTRSMQGLLECVVGAWCTLQLEKRGGAPCALCSVRERMLTLCLVLASWVCAPHQQGVQSFACGIAAGAPAWSMEGEGKAQ